MAKKNTSNDLTLENIKNVVRQVVHDELAPLDFRLTNLESEFRLMKLSFEERFDRMTNGIDKLLGVGGNHALAYA